MEIETIGGGLDGLLKQGRTRMFCHYRCRRRHAIRQPLHANA